MPNVTYTDLRNNLAKLMDRVVDDHVELLVTRQDHGSVVMMSEQDFEGWKETVYLMSSPANAARLQASIAQIEAGKGIPVALPE